jgi:hypothetical protein
MHDEKNIGLGLLATFLIAPPQPHHTPPHPSFCSLCNITPNHETQSSICESFQLMTHFFVLTMANYKGAQKIIYSLQLLYHCITNGPPIHITNLDC